MSAEVGRTEATTWKRSKKAFLQEWIFVGDDSSDEQKTTDFPVLLHSTGHTDHIRDDHPPTPRSSRPPDSLPWEPARPQDTAFFFWWVNEFRHHCLLYGHGPDATSFIQESSVHFLNALPFSNDEILSGYEDIVSSGTDQFSEWVKMDPHEVLLHHMVDVQRATADFREAS